MEINTVQTNGRLVNVSVNTLTKICLLVNNCSVKVCYRALEIQTMLCNWCSVVMQHCFYVTTTASELFGSNNEPIVRFISVQIKVVCSLSLVSGE